ncbi:mycothiol system anti-sigma-R factor [Cellulomonas massiliensis]|uniref:mycothiol system anti-sigma-R factor n=1 Tax=Cellulomonas massiliensis TaxID=1465811 RepID=UPI00031F791D|nr:mycothiol system anti-sigma-R factor [Cellulomonas massiliensis]
MTTWDEAGTPTPVARTSQSGCDCDEAVAELWAYLDSELEAPEADRVREHLAECSGCLAEHDVELVVKKLVRRCYEQVEIAPDELRARVTAHISTLRITRIADS